MDPAAESADPAGHEPGPTAKEFTYGEYVEFVLGLLPATKASTPLLKRSGFPRPHFQLLTDDVPAVIPATPEPTRNAEISSRLEVTPLVGIGLLFASVLATATLPMAGQLWQPITASLFAILGGILIAAGPSLFQPDLESLVDLVFQRRRDYIDSAWEASRAGAGDDDDDLNGLATEPPAARDPDSSPVTARLRALAKTLDARLAEDSYRAAVLLEDEYRSAARDDLRAFKEVRLSPVALGGQARRASSLQELVARNRDGQHATRIAATLPGYPPPSS